jgi:hypothetical protein
MLEGFHVKDGLYFKRNKDNSVTVYQTADEGRSDEIIFERTIPDTVWASVIASVSKNGEENNRWFTAMIWHNGIIDKEE